MAGEQVAFRRAALGSPISEQSRLIDRARVNKGGRGTGNSSSSADLTNSTYGKAVVASATPHTKGLYTELIASTAYAAETIELNITGTPSASTVNTSTLLDIAFGADLSEVVKIANLNIGHNGGDVVTIIIPFAVPAGTRIAAAIQGAVVSQSITMGASVRQSGDHSAAPTVCTTINADTATSNGTPPTAAGSTNTKAAWLELVTSAAAAYNRVLVTVSATATGTVTAATGLIDIGVGGVGVEAAIVHNIYYNLASTEFINSFGNRMAHTVNIQPGDRICIRYQATSTAAAARPVPTLHFFHA